MLLAQQAAEIAPVAPGSKEFVFGLVTGVGAAVSVVSNPLFGALSDRTTSRFGRRLPWVVAGALTGAVALLVLPAAETLAVMLLGWCLAQAGLNAMLAALTATIPDQVPVPQRGVVGGWVAVAQTLGVVGGVGIATATGGVAAGFVATAAAVVVLAVPFVLRSGDVSLGRERRPAFRLREFAVGFWVDPRQHPDFGWAWLTRFLVNLGNALGTLYLFFYLQDAVGHDDPGGRGVRADRHLRSHPGRHHRRRRHLVGPGRPPPGLRHRGRSRGGDGLGDPRGDPDLAGPATGSTPRSTSP